MKGGGSVSSGRITMRDVSDDGDDKYESGIGVKIIVTIVTIVTDSGSEMKS